MNPNDPNVVMMELVADRLGEGLRDELVFLGGAVTGLLITDPGQPAIRPTDDVDLIVNAAVRSDYQRVEDALRRQGFVNGVSADAPICRWRIGAVTVDVMPTLKDILGFSNQWYPLALASAVKTPLPSERHVRSPDHGAGICRHQARGLCRSRKRRLSVQSRSGRPDFRDRRARRTDRGMPASRCRTEDLPA